jgi:hypothetical protein
MLNQAILVGTIQKVLSPTKEILQLQIAVTRNFKEPDSEEYKTDIITVYVDKGLSKNAKSFLVSNKIIAVKARIIQPAGAPAPSIIAEKISFLSDDEKESEEK